MNFRLLQTLGSLGQKGQKLSSLVSSIPIHKTSGSVRMRHFELSEFDCLEVQADIDLIWRPGPSRARIRLRESLLRHLKLELIDRTLTLTAHCDIEGERPSIDLSGSQLSQIHIGASCVANVFDARSNVLIASAFDRSELRIQGHAKELHVETRQQASMDCASLVCDIAIAELSGESVALLRAESALQAETRDTCHLLTIGSPRILDVHRHNGPFTLQSLNPMRKS